MDTHTLTHAHSYTHVFMHTQMCMLTTLIVFSGLKFHEQRYFLFIETLTLRENFVVLHRKSCQLQPRVSEPAKPSVRAWLDKGQGESRCNQGNWS